MSYREGPITHTAGAALAQARRVKLSAGKLAYAGIEEDIGTLRDATFADGDLATVLPPDMGGTQEMTASGAITAGVNVYPDANGKITATVQGKRIGIALQAASGDGSVIEVQRLPEDADGGVTELSGATMTVTAAMCKGGHVLTSHSGAAAVNLPAGKTGMRVTIQKVDSNAAAHTITPNGSEKINGAANFASCDAQYDAVTLVWSGVAAVGWSIVGAKIA